MSEDDNDSSEDEVFMKHVDLYLTSQPSTEGKALEGILRRSSSFNKTVKFAMDEDVLQDTKDDTRRSRQELLSKISKLTKLLKEADEQIQDEKDKRKKKEKNLMKLARELKKRTTQREADKDRIEELEEKRKYLEHHWVLAQKELDQEKVMRAKIQDDTYNSLQQALKEEKEKYNLLNKEHEAHIKELKLAHSKQCDELAREILKANLEADRLHNQLNGSQRKGKLFPNKKDMRGIPTPFVFVAVALVVIAFAGGDMLFTKDSLCGPVVPWTTLGRAEAGSSYAAPWWTPQSFKAIVFENVCSKQIPPASLDWLPDGNDNKLVVRRNDSVLLSRRNLVKVEVHGSHLRLWSRKGLAEDIDHFWE